MLDRADLQHLIREHRTRPLLSLYLDAEEHDPAKRRAWRVSLAHVLERVREQVGDSASERQAFDRARAHLEMQLEPYDSFLPGRGWAGFATDSGVLYAEPLPVRMPDFGRWRQGPSVAPYMRVLRQAAPALVVLVDRVQAKVYRFGPGEVEELTELHAESDYGDLSDNVNMSKRATRSTGVRGESDTDVSQRLERVGAERLLKQLVEIVAKNEESAIVVGGPPEMTAAALQRLEKPVGDRIIEDPTIDFHTSVAALERATSAARIAVLARTQTRLLAQVADFAGAGGRGCLGRRSTERALEERKVELLLLSRRWLEGDTESAERYVDAALEQNAEVEEFVGPPGEQLDRAGEGVGARLRYV